MRKTLGKPGFFSGEDRNRTFAGFTRVFEEFERCLKWIATSDGGSYTKHNFGSNLTVVWLNETILVTKDGRSKAKAQAGHRPRFVKPILLAFE